MRAIDQERRRFGYRRLRILLRREGYLVNHKRLFRLYRTNGSRYAAEVAASAISGRERR